MRSRARACEALAQIAPVAPGGTFHDRDADRPVARGPEGRDGQSIPAERVLAEEGREVDHRDVERSGDQVRDRPVRSHRAESGLEGFLAEEAGSRRGPQEDRMLVARDPDPDDRALRLGWRTRLGERERRACRGRSIHPLSLPMAPTGREAPMA